MSALSRFGVVAATLMILPLAAIGLAGLLGPSVVTRTSDRVIDAPVDKVWQGVTGWQLWAAKGDPMMPPVGSRSVEPATGNPTLIRYAIGQGQTWEQEVAVWEPGKTYAFRNRPKVGAPAAPMLMRFDLEPAASGSVKVVFSTRLEPKSFMDKAFGVVFGLGIGTLEGYQRALLDGLEGWAEGRMASGSVPATDEAKATAEASASVN
ncbi:MAG: SRPBCC family protein [Candidatus Sericytochromatia bacterium]|nr:SRPBCC family protein [Candidatus Sericytochromatia bacterium]